MSIRRTCLPGILLVVSVFHLSLPAFGSTSSTSAGSSSYTPVDLLSAGISQLSQYLHTDAPPVPSYLTQAGVDFSTVRADQPGNVTNRFYAATTAVIGLMTNAALQQVFANYGLTAGTIWGVQGTFDTNATQTVDQAVDAGAAQALPALDAAYADLDAIPTNWPGAFAISQASFPNLLEEDVWIDIGDVLAMKAALKALSASIRLTESYEGGLDYPNLENRLQPPTPQLPIVVDGATNDWAGVPPNLIGAAGDAIQSITTAAYGTNAYVLITFPASHPSFYYMSFDIKVNGLDVFVGHSDWGTYCYCADTNIHQSLTGFWSETNCEVCVAFLNIIPTQVRVGGVDCYSGTTLNGTWEDMRLDSPGNWPISQVLPRQPSFLSAIRNTAARATARTNLLEAINLVFRADAAVGRRTDGQLHLMNIDPADVDAADKRLTMRTELARIQASLLGPTGFAFMDQDGQQSVKTVFMGAFFGAVANPGDTPPTVAPRALLPPLTGPLCQMQITGPFPDPTLGGVLPGMDNASLTQDMSAGLAPLPAEHVSYPQIAVVGQTSSTNWVIVGQSVLFQAQNAACNEGHAVECQFDWGDGSTSVWDSASDMASHAWLTTGVYTVRAQARCTVDTNVVSVWSAPLTVFVALQPTHYVSAGSLTPSYPYATWDTAATTIQDAIDAAVEPNALVLVGSGVYNTGSRTYNGVLANRIVIDRPVTVMGDTSGPLPIIEGNADPVTGDLGPGAARCAYVASGAMLSGFVLQQGRTLSGADFGDIRDFNAGGVLLESGAFVQYCIIASNAAANNGGGVWSDGGQRDGGSGGYLQDCYISANNAGAGGGGGAFGCTLSDCMLIGNNANSGGGAGECPLLVHCMLSGNLAQSAGGGAYDCQLLDHCMLTNNTAQMEGGGFVGGWWGASQDRLLRCAVICNVAASAAGGGENAGLENCLVGGNSSGWSVGAVQFCTIENCTIAGNAAAYDYGGVYGCWTIGNSIIWSNWAPSHANWDSDIIQGMPVNTYSNNCTTPLMPGAGNIAADPLFLALARGNCHLSSLSPCIDAGNNDNAPGSLDLEGGARIRGACVDMGAYEYLALPAAVRCTNVVWTTGGAAPWFGQSMVTVDGADAAQSGAIGDATNSWLQAAAEGKGTLTFQWRVDSEARLDVLRFTADGKPVAAISGTTTWQTVTLLVTNTGSHIFFWEYAKSKRNAVGADAGWLAQVVWTPVQATVAVTVNPPEGGRVTGSGPCVVGSVCELVALPNRGWRFDHWENGSVTAQRTLVVPDGGTNCTANFVHAPISLAAALDTESQPELVWSTGGDAPWNGWVLPTAHDDGDAAQSGVIGDSEYSWVETTVTGAGLFAFWWRVSSEAECDFLSLYVDGACVDWLSGDSGWQMGVVALGAGTHTLDWVYNKDETMSMGEDAAWLDQVVWSPSVPPLRGFALWQRNHGLSGSAATVFGQVSDSDHIPYGLVYAFGSYLSDGLPVLDIRFIDSHPVADVLMQDPNTTADVSLTVEACTNLPGDNWSLPVEPETDASGKPGNRAWYRLHAGARPDQAYFRIKAELK